MKWEVQLHDDFIIEFERMPENVQDAIVVRAKLLQEFGSELARPYVDTLKGSAFNNMKELRFSVGKEVWRVAFAFDPARDAILLVGGDKRGKSQKKFYTLLISIADKRYLQHLKTIKT